MSSKTMCFRGMYVNVQSLLLLMLTFSININNHKTLHIYGYKYYVYYTYVLQPLQKLMPDPPHHLLYSLH